MELKKKILEVRKYFLATEETIAVAESVTSGLLQFFFSIIPDAGKFYQGGITTYNLGQKYRHLNVEPIHAQNHNCVSPKVSEQMAVAVCTLFNSDWGIGITGYSTPVPESDNKQYAYYAICNKRVIKVSKMVKSAKLSPAKVQQLYADEVITQLTALLNKKGDLPFN